MLVPNFSTNQYIDAPTLNAAAAAVSGDMQLAMGGNTAGLINPTSASYTTSGLSVTASLPSPFAVLFGNGVLAQAFGTTTGQSTSSYTVSFAGVVPASGSVTAYLVASYQQIQQNSISVIGPPVGHPDYNPNFQPYTAYELNVDSLALSATSGAPDNATTFELFRCTLAAGATGIVPVQGFAVYSEQESPPTTAGGFVNQFRNATFDIWNRGTSGSITAGTSGYTADGWVIGSAGATTAWAQATGLGLSVYSLKLTGAVGVTDTYITQRIESFLAAKFAGRYVTVQARILNNTGATLTPTLTVAHLNSSDIGVSNPWPGGSITTDISAQPLQTIAGGASGVVFYRFLGNANTGNGMAVTLDFGAALSSAAKNLLIAELDIRADVYVDTPEMRPISIEQPICARYLPSLTSGGYSGDVFLGICGCYTNNTNNFVGWQYGTPTRVVCSGITISNAAHFIISTSNGGAVTLSSLTSVSFGIQGMELEPIATSTTNLSQGNAILLGTANAAASIIVTGAEL